MRICHTGGGRAEWQLPNCTCECTYAERDCAQRSSLQEKMSRLYFQFSTNCLVRYQSAPSGTGVNVEVQELVRTLLRIMLH